MTMKVTNKVTGVTISLDEKAAGRLGPEWEAAKSSPTRKPAPRKRTTKPDPASDQPADGEE